VALDGGGKQLAGTRPCGLDLVVGTALLAVHGIISRAAVMVAPTGRVFNPPGFGRPDTKRSAGTACAMPARSPQ
jgi:hypothetical protein